MSSVRDAVVSAATGEAEDTAKSAVINAVKHEAAVGNVELAVGIAAIGGIVAGVYYLDVKWHHHQAHEILNQVNRVEVNIQTHLKRIPVSASETLDMADPFERDPKTNLLHAGKEYKTLHELRVMVDSRASEGFSPQADDAIHRAMSKVLEFYEDRLKRFWLWKGDEGDVTSAYLRYMLCRMNEYGKKFQGTEYTKHILLALHDSLNDFSMDHGEKSERRTYLDLACRSLKKAVKALGQQKKDRTLADLIADATPECDELGTRLLKNLTKLATPLKQYEHVDRCFDTQLLAEGFIKKEAPHGKPGTHPGAITLNTSPIGKNLQVIAQHYNEAKGLIESKSEALTAATVPLKTRDFSEEEKQQSLALFTHHDKLLGFDQGLHVNNFMTTTSRQLKKDSESGTTIPFNIKTEGAQILARLEGLHQLAQLNNDDILVMKLFYKLQHYAKEKGDEFIANPQNAHFMFDVLLSLNKAVRKDANKCSECLDKVEEDHQFKTLDPDQAHLLTETRQLVIAIREEIESSIKAIEHYRTETHYEQIEAKIHIEEHETLKLFAQVAQDKGLKVAQNLVQKSEVTPPVVPPRPPKSTLSTQPQGLSAVPSSSTLITAELKKEGGKPDSKTEIKPVAPPQRLPRRLPVKADISLKDLDTELAEIEAQITKNSSEDFRRPYEALHAALMHLRNDYFAMHGDTEPDRKLKGDKTKDLTYELCLVTRNFLCQPMSKRHAQAMDFAQGLLQIVNRHGNQFMDVPFGKVDVYVEEHKEGFMGYFQRNTTTHQHFKALLQAAFQIAHRLQPKPALRLS